MQKSKTWIILYVGGHVETDTVLGKYTVEDSIALVINILNAHTLWPHHSTPRNLSYRHRHNILDNMYQFSSTAQSCPTLCDPMNCSTPGLPVHHQLLEFTQTHVHRVGDAIQPSHPLLSPPPPAPNPSQHQGLFQWVNSSHEVAKEDISCNIDYKNERLGVNICQ